MKFAFFYTLALLFTFFVMSASAADGFPVAPTLAISGPVIVVTPLPEFTAEMDSDEFYAWATEQNDLAYIKSLSEHKAVQEKQGDLTRRVTFTERSDHISRRFGGGVGAGGFGGAGGYAGYTRNTGGSQLGGGYNLGFGFSNNGNASSTSNDSVTKTYEMVYRDRTYYGSPVMVINPFCKP